MIVYNFREFVAYKLVFRLYNTTDTIHLQIDSMKKFIVIVTSLFIVFFQWEVGLNRCTYYPCIY